MGMAMKPIESRPRRHGPSWRGKGTIDGRDGHVIVWLRQRRMDHDDDIGGGDMRTLVGSSDDGKRPELPRVEQSDLEVQGSRSG